MAYEDNQLKFINDFKKDIDVVFFRCDEEFQHISSSAIRNLQSFRPGSGGKYLIWETLRENTYHKIQLKP